MKTTSEIISVKGLKYNLVRRVGGVKNAPIFFLHGFTGSSLDWEEVIELIPARVPIFAVDLIGHGKTASPEIERRYSEESQLDDLKFIIRSVCERRPILAGYSMGGRLALKFAVKNENALGGLILESSTAGIINEEEREKRIESDTALASDILNFGIEKFIDEWMEKPLFNSLKNLPTEKYVSIVETKKTNSPAGLANSLKNFGGGKMKHAWEDLPKLNLPIQLLCGELDPKFRAINKEMKKLIRGSEFNIIPSAGHNVHLEKPADFVNFVLEFWNKINYRNE